MKKVVYQHDTRYNKDCRGCFGYLQYGRDMRVYDSYAMIADNYHEERLTVVNRLYVADQKVCGSAIPTRFRVHYM